MDFCRDIRGGCLACLLALVAAGGAFAGTKAAVQRASEFTPEERVRIARASSFEPAQGLLRRSAFDPSGVAAIARRSEHGFALLSRFQAVYSPDELQRLNRRSDFSADEMRRIQARSQPPPAWTAGMASGERARYISRSSQVSGGESRRFGSEEGRTAFRRFLQRQSAASDSAVARSSTPTPTELRMILRLSAD